MAGKSSQSSDLSILESKSPSNVRTENTFNNTRKPFTITVAKEKNYILTAPQDVEEAYKNTAALTFNGFTDDLVRLSSVSAWTVDTIFTPYTSPPTEKRSPDPKLMQEMDRLRFKQQFLACKKVDEFAATFVQLVNSMLHIETLSPHCVVSATPERKIVSLLQWSQDTMLTATTKTLFGDKILQIDPAFCATFAAFDHTSWKLFFRYPRFLSSEMYEAKEQLT